MTASAPSHSLEVVVIDDNPDAADTLALLFNLMGHNAHVAYDARSGSRLVTDVRPDLAIFDLDLPDLDGCEALRSVLKGSAPLHALFVCLTGRDTWEAKQRCTDAGFHRFLTKPLSGTEVEALLALATQRKHQRGSSQRCIVDCVASA